MQNNMLFADFFRADIVPQELPNLADLIQGQPILNAFITLFRGGEDEVMVRLMILREVGARAKSPYWTRAEIDQHFSYVNATKLDTVLTRLRENQILIWDQDAAHYRLSEVGRLVLTALSTLLSFTQADAELGYLTAQVVAGHAMSTVSTQTLQHLLARINELYHTFSIALESQSEYQIYKAQKQLNTVWHWVEKGTEVIREILRDDTLDLITLNQVQAIALAQSRMLNLTGTFEKRLAQLQAQRVHLGESGLNSSDIAQWLLMQTQDQLLALVQSMLTTHPEPHFLTPNEFLDIAEYELFERERVEMIKTEMPQNEVAPNGESEFETPILSAAEALYSRLQEIVSPTSLDRIVLAPTYRETAYRLSLLSLLGDPESAVENSVIADFVKLPLSFTATEAVIHLTDHPEVVSMSEGLVSPLIKMDKLS